MVLSFEMAGIDIRYLEASKHLDEQLTSADNDAEQHIRLCNVINAENAELTHVETSGCWEGQGETYL